MIASIRTGSFKRDAGGVSQSGRRASCRIVGGNQVLLDVLDDDDVVVVVAVVVVLCYNDIDQFEDKLMIELLGELGEGQLLGFNVFRFDAFQKQVLFV